MHANLEWAGHRSGIFLGHASEVLREAVEGLACSVVAEEDTMLEVGSGQFVAQRSSEPDTGGDYVNHRAGFQMSEDALELMFVVWRMYGEGVGGDTA